MIRLPRPLALIALLVPLSLAACAAAPPPAASAEPPPPGVFSVGQRREVSPIDGEMLALAHAEEEIDRTFPAPAAERTSPRKGAKPAPADDGDKLSRSKEEPLAAGGDRCSIACTALASMASSAERLCKLAGETDGRCEDAQARVRGATSRVKSSCPACSIALAAPPPPPARPKGTPPAGPAPGMPASTPPGMPPPQAPPGMPGSSGP
jgi:hypothetical protein